MLNSVCVCVLIVGVCADYMLTMCLPCVYMGVCVLLCVICVHSVCVCVCVFCVCMCVCVCSQTP